RASTAARNAPVSAPPKNVSPTPTNPWSVPSSSVTKSRVAVPTSMPTTSGLSAGARSRRGGTWLTFLALSDRLPRRRRVLAGELGGRALLPFLLAVEPGLASPRALQVVPHVQAQPPQFLGLELDHVAVLKRAEPAMIGTGRDHVSGLEGVD